MKIKQPVRWEAPLTNWYNGLITDIFISGDKAVVKRSRQIPVRYEVGEGLEVLYKSPFTNSYKWRPF